MAAHASTNRTADPTATVRRDIPVNFVSPLIRATTGRVRGARTVAPAR